MTSKIWERSEGEGRGGTEGAREGGEEGEGWMGCGAAWREVICRCERRDIGDFESGALVCIDGIWWWGGGDC